MIRYGSIPLGIAVGRVSHLEEMTEATARLACLGRDAFLETTVTPGLVNYIPGPDPVLETAPVPEDPCGVTEEPVVEPGDAASEPTTPEVPTAAEDQPAAPGPEGQPEPEGSFNPPPRVIYGHVNELSPFEGVWHESEDPLGRLRAESGRRTFINEDDIPILAEETDPTPQRFILIVRSPLVTIWTKDHPYSTHDRIRRFPSDPHVWRLTSGSGTSGPNAPLWNLSGNTDDGDLTWTHEAVQSPLASFTPGTHLRIVMSASISSGAAWEMRTRPVTAKAPVNLDEVLTWSFGFLEANPSGTQVFQRLSPGHADTVFSVEVGEAEQIVITPVTGALDSVSLSLKEAQFYTP